MCCALVRVTEKHVVKLQHALEAAIQVSSLWVWSLALSWASCLGSFGPCPVLYLPPKALPISLSIHVLNLYPLVFNSCLILLQKEKKGRRRTSKVSDGMEPTQLSNDIIHLADKTEQ